MSSNILTGERRWASARRTGMTVLGKVAVPKPLNLPSQKLENHGMDPNVEIVPKGSVGWGSRPSSSASNPWGSSSISSTAEGRPSSSGSRPSTAGSEIVHDHGGNAWGPSSRPSSASGIPASNQTSLTSLRPHSADTRPASSQISRFAEQHTDGVVAHHPAVSSEQVGLASASDKERFSLSAGDFPTLNSVADGSLKSSDSRDQGSHSRPTSASGGVTKKDNSDISQADVEKGTVTAWKREGNRNSDEMHPSMDKWHGEPPYYHNANVPPPQFDGWRGPSMNHPGVWYQGLPPGPPYGPPVGPGGFPVEPPSFSFYCPRVPSSGLPNSQQVPLTRPGPMGHPKNGELYRPQMPDSFVRPGMPFRPGLYHGPPMPFEGYYGPPPMGYRNPNELEVPFKGMPPGPPAYNRYPTRDNDPVEFNDSTTTHNRTGKNGSGIKRFSEKAEPNHLSDAPEHVILKHNEDGNHGGQWGGNVAMQNYPNPNLKKRSQHGMVSRTKEWGADYNNEDDMYSMNVHSSSAPLDGCGGSDSFTIRSGPYGSGDTVLRNNIQLKKLETAVSLVAGDVGLSSSAISSGPAPSLIKRIDDLNEKARTSDSRNEGSHPSQWVEQKGPGALIGEIIVPLGDQISHVATSAAPRRGYGVLRGKTIDHNKQKSNEPKTAASVQSPDIFSASNFHENRTNATMVAAEVDSEVVDATDSQAQRLKMREMVKQRALQLQKEEEERTREQKAKALAKLEELNRRNTMIHKDENAGPEITHYESSRTGGGEWGEDEPPDSGNYLHFETLKITVLDTPADLPNQSLPPLKEESLVVPPQLNDATTDKQTGYKQKQYGGRKTFMNKARNNNTELADSEIGNAVQGDVGSGNDSKTSDIIIHGTVESSSSQQKRRSSNRNTKNKHNNKSGDFLPVPTTWDESKPPTVSIKAVDNNGDGIQGGVNHHHQKPQKSNRFARNQPSNRFSDKYNGNDNVVWAPVQPPHNKTEPATETGLKTVDESVAISAKNDDQMQNNMKSKRAEMERYVPKPVAKELAHQSTVQQSDEVAENVVPVTESRVEDLKHNNKQTKAVGGWRQRGPSTFKPNSRNQQSMEPELSNTKTQQEEQSGFKDPPNASDDAGRYQENTGSRAKRHVVKGERSMRNDQKSDKTHIHQQDPKANPNVKSSSKENRGSEDRPSSSHWQPKSNAPSGGDSISTSQNVAGGSFKNGNQSLPEEHVREVDSSSRADPSVLEGNFSTEGSFNGQQGQRREKKVPYSSKHESTFVGSEQHQHFSSDYSSRRGGRYHQNVPYVTSREFRGDLNHERHGHNIHYEYQPIPIPGKNHEKKFENTEDGGSRGVGPTRYKEKSQHSRRGRGGTISWATK